MSAGVPTAAAAPQNPAPVVVVSPEPAVVLAPEKPRPTIETIAVAAEDTRTSLHHTRTFDDPEKLSVAERVQTHNSLIGFPPNVYDNTDAPAAAQTTEKGLPDDKDPPTSPASEHPDDWDAYTRFGRGRKIGIAILMGWCGLISPVSSTALLAALPEAASTFGTTGTIISLSNALYLFVMGFSPPFWGPMSQVYGRKPISIWVLSIVMVCSIGTALSPNLGAFFFFRLATAFAGTSLMVLGSAVIGDMFHPTERATGLSYLPARSFGDMGPFMGSVVVTFCPWRVIYWVQAGMCLLGLIGVVLIMPETLLTLRKDALVGMTLPQRIKTVATWSLTNPIKMFRLLRYPNLICTAAVASGLAWNQYALLTPIRYVLNPRFGLTSPLQSGFLFLAPGVGCLFGSLVGSRWADYVACRWIRKRNGLRVPEDRLRSFLPVVLVFLPACQLIYGWSVQKEVGGLPVPVIFMALNGFCSMVTSPSVDTYLLDVKQERAAEVIGGNFMIKFWAAAAGAGVALPMTNAVGVGWFSTMTAALLALTGVAAAMTAYWGMGWREKVDEKKRLRQELRDRREQEAGAITVGV